MKIQYRTPVHNVPWCTETGCFKSVKLIERRADRLVIEIESITDDAPFSDCFKCKECWIVLGPEQNADHKQCIFVRMMTIEFHKSTMLKGTID